MSDETETEEEPVWVAIADSHVRHIWRDKHTGEEFPLSPAFYEENGTPCSNDGDDCEYLRSEIRLL